MSTTTMSREQAEALTIASNVALYEFIVNRQMDWADDAGELDEIDRLQGLIEQFYSEKFSRDDIVLAYGRRKQERILDREQNPYERLQSKIKRASEIERIIRRRYVISVDEAMRIIAEI